MGYLSNAPDSYTLRPDTDTSLGSWTDDAGGTTTIYTDIDETDPDDADYVRSSLSPTSADTYKVRLSNPSGTVDTSERVWVRYQFGKIVGTDELDLTVRLVEGSTTRATWEHENVPSAPDYAVQELTSAQKTAITDWDDLFLEFEAIKPEEVTQGDTGQGGNDYDFERGKYAIIVTSTAGPITALTHNGVTLTSPVDSTQDATTLRWTTLVEHTFSESASGAMTVTGGGNNQIACWRLRNVTRQTSVTDTVGQTDNGNFDTNTTAGHFAIAAIGKNTASANATWGNLTEFADLTNGAFADNLDGVTGGTPEAFELMCAGGGGAGRLVIYG